jgi:2-keto-4-pentenoate hydratase/2-oxohepta-3-ene-1,7-dioic acid hydratase in catechol pathway
MKLLRHGLSGAEKPGLLHSDGTIRDLTGLVPDIGGHVLSDAGIAMLRGIDASTLPVVPSGTRLGPCVAGTGKFICIGLNYSDHAAETGATVPPEPIIGTRAKYVTEAEALNHVAGYAVTNDVSERAFQIERSGQWTKGKSCDNFGQIGPWLVTRDEVADPQDMPMWLTVNGKTYQNGSTKTMVYGVAHLVSYLSQFMTLHPGDVISTGTPPGVGLGQKPPHYLKAGDVVELGIAGLGQQRQDVIADPE